jgi:hypothetical protein
MIVSILLKLARQHGFDAVNLGGDVAGRESGDLCDRRGVEAFEIGKDDVAVERFQLLNQIQKTIEGVAAVNGGLAAGRVR